MIRDTNNIDDLFKSGLKGLKQKPSVNAWSRLDNSLDIKQSRKKIMFFRMAAAVILVLMAFTAGFYYASYLNEKQSFAEENTIPATNIPSTEFANQDMDKNPETIEIPETVNDLNISDDVATVLENGHHNASNLIDDELSVQDKSYNNMLVSTGDVSKLEDNKAEPLKSNIASMAMINVKRLDIAGFENNSGSGASDYELSNSNSNALYYLSPDYYDYDDIIPNNSIAKWSLGAQFAPTYSYRDISTNYSFDQSTISAEENFNNVENALLSYSGGMDVGYNFSGKWSLQSGVYFSRIGQVNNDALQFTNQDNQILLAAINTSTGSIDVIFERVPENVRKINSPKDTINIGDAENVKIVQNFDLFEVPLLVRYKLGNRKFKVNFTGGLSPAYLLKNSTYLELEENKYDVGDASNLNSMIVNSSLGLGLEYFITKGLSLNFEPTFKYALNPINKSSDFSYHPYSFSWFTGIRIKIK